MDKIIHVGFGEYRISDNPDSVLICFGLGSCVAVTMYDTKKKMGGMIHVVLPSTQGRPTQSLARFADSGIPFLLEEMKKMGADKRRLIVTVSGGAKILKLHYPINDYDIGSKNVEKTLEVLKQLGLSIHGQETGGTRGRTVRLHIKSGETFVRQRGEKLL
jgi:chemotaxis protein CheD